MIDIHCHPLWGVDDGARSFEISVAMCKMAAADGITHLVATPHCNYMYEFDPEINQAKLVQLQAAVGEVPRLLSGCDLHLCYDNLRQLIDQRRPFTINQSDYVLVELGDQFAADQLEYVFHELQGANLVPVLTHPERHPVFQRRPQLLYRWVTRGGLVQVTAKSYTGGFGRRARHFAELWLEQNLIHFFASDAHDVKHRPPILSPCYQKVANAHGQEIADLLLKRNPEAVIQGRPLPRGLEPLEPAVVKRRRSWLSFFER
jgi:protein-tyrosine phosphatase